MTRPRDPYAAFLRALRKTPRRWRLTKQGELRFSPDAQARRPLVPHEMTWFQCWSVFDAMDRRPGHDPRLRARLLRACGLRKDKR